MAQQTPEPVDVRYDNAGQRLEITWENGKDSAYHYEFLRWRCPCAACAGEMGQPGALQSTQTLRPEQYQLERIDLVGAYGLRPTWADGHDSGIFTFERLHQWSGDAAEDLRSARVRGTRPTDA